MLNLEFICVTGTIPSNLENWGKKVNVSNGVVEIQQKYEREREKVKERKFWISVITLPKFWISVIEIPAAQTCWLKTNCGNATVEIGEKNFVAIVAMSLPKIGGNK